MKLFLKIRVCDTLEPGETSVPCKFYADTEDKSGQVRGGTEVEFLGKAFSADLDLDKQS